jgi:hypothetical protein
VLIWICIGVCARIRECLAASHSRCECTTYSGVLCDRRGFIEAPSYSSESWSQGVNRTARRTGFLDSAVSAG